ncbi:hypothetical protein [Parabacteroides johnsonii]|uniref:hypothetical protein n=1 Tax=Parabacteroides johnsonii TaxID=387661 RepID=UPI00267183BB|nr:hypothetical protein [Parabacteroides johnsonii]
MITYIMLVTKQKRRKKTIIDGIVMRPVWSETFKNFKVGESRTFYRPDLTTTQARTTAAKLNTSTNMKFSVSTGELDEYCIVKREA